MYGSFQNMVSSGPAEFDPEVGMGATILMWTDRVPVTIVDVTFFKSGSRKGEVRSVLVQRDLAKRTDENGMSDCQSYEFSPNPDASKQEWKKRKDGTFRMETRGDVLRIGQRDKYYDFSF